MSLDLFTPPLSSVVETLLNGYLTMKQDWISFSAQESIKIT